MNIYVAVCVGCVILGAILGIVGLIGFLWMGEKADESKRKEECR